MVFIFKKLKKTLKDSYYDLIFEIDDLKKELFKNQVNFLEKAKKSLILAENKNEKKDENIDEVSVEDDDCSSSEDSLNPGIQELVSQAVENENSRKIKSEDLINQDRSTTNEEINNLFDLAHQEPLSKSTLTHTMTRETELMILDSFISLRGKTLKEAMEYTEERGFKLHVLYVGNEKNPYTGPNREKVIGVKVDNTSLDELVVSVVDVGGQDIHNREGKISLRRVTE